MLPPFHGERMQTYGQLICDLTHEIIGKLQPGESFIARQVTQEVSLQVILEAVYGLDSDRSQLKQRITKLANIFESTLTSALLFLPWLQKDLGAWESLGQFYAPTKSS